MLYRVSRQIQLDKIFWYTQRLLRFDKLIYTNEILFRNFHWPTTTTRRRRGYDIHPDACDSSTPLHCLLCVRVFPINVKHSELAPTKHQQQQQQQIDSPLITKSITRIGTRHCWSAISRPTWPSSPTIGDTCSADRQSRLSAAITC